MVRVSGACRPSNHILLGLFPMHASSLNLSYLSQIEAHCASSLNLSCLLQIEAHCALKDLPAAAVALEKLTEGDPSFSRSREYKEFYNQIARIQQ